MGDIQTRPFSKNYSGLVNQSVTAASIAIICVAGHEIMKRHRRGKRFTQDLGSRESWEFGYLFQGRCWARSLRLLTHENIHLNFWQTPFPTISNWVAIIMGQ
ncbi:hypothetical protein F5887DRAFT_495869 [Amanita rubescens]|nr:hypothetical protein F5887DRAFT_495869 [Amanita rubescens]